MRYGTKKKVITVTAFVIIVLLILAMLIPALSSKAESASDQLGSLQQKQKQLEQQQKQLQSQLSSNKSDQNKITQAVNGYYKIMQVDKQKIDLLNNKINDCNAKIANLDNDIAATQKRIEQNTELYKQRVCALYEAGNVSRLQVLLSSKSVTDFLARFDIIKMISQHDNDLISQLKSDKQKVESDKKAVVAQRDSLTVTQTQLKSEQNYYNSLSSQQNALLNQLKDKQSVIESQKEAVDAAEAADHDKIAQLERQIAQEQASSGGSAPVYSGGGWMWPIQGIPTRISSSFGDISSIRSGPHTGIDIAGGKGVVILDQPIHAATGGIVIYSDYQGSYGNHVIINDGGGICTLYGHMSVNKSHVGQVVKKGDIIGLVGSTGNSTGPHLHFEVDVNGTPVNPFKYVSMP